MRGLFKARFAVAVLLIAILVAGCGGGGGFVSGVEGTWSGPFQVYNSNGSVESSGNMTLEIDSFGGAFVTLQRTDSNFQTQFINNGSLSNNRELRFVWHWDNTNDRESKGIIRRNGNFLQPDSQDNRIQVTYSGGAIGGMEFTLTRQGTL